MTRQEQFIAQIAPIVVSVCKARGWGVPSAIVAQACCESNYGASKLSASYHNYFGLKCGSAWKGASVNMSTKEEYTVGTLVSIKDNFRVYSNMTSGVEGYFDFLNTKRYATVRVQKLPMAYLTAVKAAGYCTSSTYINTCMNIINKYNLQVWDTVNASTVVATPVQQFIVGKVYTTQVKLNVRSTPVDGSILKVYPINTRCTCKELVTVNGELWMRTPSGWICTGKGGKAYVS